MCGKRAEIPNNAVCRTGTIVFACLESKRVISRQKTVCFVHLCVKIGERKKLIAYSMIVMSLISGFCLFIWIDC